VIKIPSSFYSFTPFFGEWLDLELEKAYQLPEKVQRANVPRGHLYPLARKKTLFALLLSIRSTAGLSLKRMAELMDTPYNSIRHWVKEERVRKKTRDFAQQFVDKFLEQLLFVITALRMDGSHGWPVVTPDELKELKIEATFFHGLILELLIKKLVQVIKDDEEINFRLLDFIDYLSKYGHPGTIHTFEQLYRLSYEVRKKILEYKFSRLEDQIKTDAGLAIHTARDIKSDVFAILDRLNSFELYALETIEHQRQGKDEKPRDKRKKATT